jgi:hypothetical protein
MTRRMDSSMREGDFLALTVEILDIRVATGPALQRLVGKRYRYVFSSTSPCGGKLVAAGNAIGAIAPANSGREQPTSRTPPVKQSFARRYLSFYDC